MNKGQVVTLICVLMGLLQGLYLFLFESASLWYVINVLAHIPVGIGILFLAWRFFQKERPSNRNLSLVVKIVAVSGFLAGIWIALAGNTNDSRAVLGIHAILMSLAATGFIAILVKHVNWSPTSRKALAGCAAIAALLVAFAIRTNPSDVIVNETMMPATMAGESMDGEDGPFFPSAASTADGGLIPEEFFLDSQSCGRSGCHVDAYNQWNASAHHFASFNNQWYRKSIEYMQDVVGTQPPQWCAGCHDHALLFSGKMNQPVANFVDTEAAQAGLGCISCHAISEVKNTGGNAAFEIEYPRMHKLASSENQVIQKLHDLVIHLDPDPHRRTFLKPFHIDQTAEFCSSCHKVHLDKPVNSYRWVRGFNTYDNWQASGVSHEGARSFYAPESPMTCVTCHMPQIASEDAGNDDGYIRAHDFVAANTALPVANQDSVHLNKTIDFLRSSQLKVDIFAVSEPYRRTSDESDEAGDPFGALSSTFAVGDEQGMVVGGAGSSVAATPVIAPLESGMSVLQPSTTVRLDVVVRTLGLGHFFPSGTVDAQEAWLEVKVTDSDGDVLLWSGFVDENGDVDPSAHFYRSLLVDQHGNPIDKRNAWASRSAVYVNLIPPGAADIGHYIINVPGDTDSLFVEARVNYRKFIQSHTRFSYAGIMEDGTGDVSPHYDNRKTALMPVQNVSGLVQEIPEVPVVTMAQDRKRLAVSTAPLDEGDDAGNAIRWNDYGIGLLREGDLRGSENAFRVVSEDATQSTSGYINLARVYLAEGSLDMAIGVLDSALAAEPDNHKARFFHGLYFKAVGDYSKSLAELEFVHERFPRDRVVLNQIGRVNFLSENMPDAISAFEKVLLIDPEDLMAHYNLMLAYRVLGDTERSAAHETRYLRYKEDEASREISREYRQNNPFDNNEALPIHEHRNYFTDD